MKFLKFFTLCSLALLAGCAGSSNGDDLEVPTNLPPICQGIDFVAEPDMRDLCGVRRVRYKAYINIPQQRYLIKPADASIVKEKNRLELRFNNSLPIELPGVIAQDLEFSQEKRLEKIKNTYDYVEFFPKGQPRQRVFKLSIPTEAGRTHNFCFRIPERSGNARTRSVAMGTNIEQIACSEYERVLSLKKASK